MKLVVCLAVVAGALLAPLEATPERAGAAVCGLPDKRPMWVDFGDGSVPFWDRIFKRPGLVVAASNFLMPPQLRAGGAKTVYFDLNLKTRVGTPTEPLTLNESLDWGDRMFLRAAASAGCGQPVMALNELFGAGTVPPWTERNAQYRANVLGFIQRLSGRGARPVLLVSSPPYTGGEAGDWWRQVAEVADLVPEVYFPAPSIYRQGPVVGSRRLRVASRVSSTSGRSGRGVGRLGPMRSAIRTRRPPPASGCGRAIPSSATGPRWRATASSRR